MCKGEERYQRMAHRRTVVDRGKITTPSVSSEFVPDAEATYQVVVQAQQTQLTYMRQDASVARSDPQPDDTGNLLFISFSGEKWTVVNVGRILG